MTMQVNYVGLIVSNLATATAFYRDQLGWSVNEAESIPGAYTQFDLAGGAIVSLQADSEITTDQRFETAIQVDNADTVYATWQAQGVAMIDEPNDKPFGRTFLFRTPEGHVWRAYSPPAVE